MLALIQRFGRKIKLETIGQGAYDTNGNWVRGPKVQVDIIASVQPLTPDELQRLPENQSNREAVKIYTTTKIVVASDKTQKNSEVLVIDGRLVACNHSVTLQRVRQNSISTGVGVHVGLANSATGDEVGDIHALKLSDKIRIDNSWWNINRVIDYNANTDGLTKVELISVDSELELAPFITNTGNPSPSVTTEAALNSVLRSSTISGNVILDGSQVAVMGRGNTIAQGVRGLVIGDGQTLNEDGILTPKML